MKRVLSVACLFAAVLVSTARAADGVLFPGYTPPPTPPSAAQIVATQIVITALTAPLP